MIDWERYGFRVCGEACDGEEALGKIRELKPDLVVTDIRMPVMDGLQLIEHCTNVLKAPSRFVILSGHDDFPSARIALSYGVLDYWLKPIDVEEIHVALEKIGGEWATPVQDQYAELSPVAAWSTPDIGDSLFDAEDRLTLAVKAGDEAEIGVAANRLCLLLETTIAGDREAGKAFLSNVLLELAWEVSEGEEADRTSAGEQEQLSLPMLPSKPDSWAELLASFSLKVAERLARQRKVTGPAWEVARIVQERYGEPPARTTASAAVDRAIAAFPAGLSRRAVQETDGDVLPRLRPSHAGRSGSQAAEANESEGR